MGENYIKADFQSVEISNWAEILLVAGENVAEKKREYNTVCFCQIRQEQEKRGYKTVRFCQNT